MWFAHGPQHVGGSHALEARYLLPFAGMDGPVAEGLHLGRDVVGVDEVEEADTGVDHVEVGDELLGRLTRPKRSRRSDWYAACKLR